MMLRKKIILIFGLLTLALLLWSCAEDEEPVPVGPGPTDELTADCIGCHTNEDLLKETAVPDEEPPGDPSGEG